MTVEVEKYLEEIIQELDFGNLNDFLYGHMRLKMSFEEMVARISAEGLVALDAETITKFVFDSFLYEMAMIRPMFLKMLIFTLLFSVIQNVLASKNKYISRVSFLMIYASLMVLLIQSFTFVKDLAIDGIDTLLSFLNALIPTYAVTLVFSGNAVSGAMIYEMAFILVYLIESLMKRFLSPMIHLFILILCLNHLFEEDKLSKLAHFLETVIVFLLKTAFGMIAGLGMVQSLLSPVKDRIASHIALSGVSSIPGVGAFMGSAGEVVLSCAMLIKNSVGVLGLVFLFFLAAVPVLKIGCFWLMYQLLAITLQPVSDARVTECVIGVAQGCSLYLKMIIYSMLLFFVLFAMISVATSFVF